MDSWSRRTAAGVLVHPDEAWQAVAAMAAGQVDTRRVGLAVMHLRGALVDVCGQTEQKQSVQDSSSSHLISGLERLSAVTGV